LKTIALLVRVLAVNGFQRHVQVLLILEFHVWLGGAFAQALEGRPSLDSQDFELCKAMDVAADGALNPDSIPTADVLHSWARIAVDFSRRAFLREVEDVERLSGRRSGWAL
jgi:hypothetical protein